MDAASPESARKFYEQAGVTFVRGIDRADTLWATLGFHVVPNGLFWDELGIVRYAKFGGFEAREARDVAEIERLLAEPVTPAAQPTVVEVREGGTPAVSATPLSTGAYWFRRGVEALQKGDKKAALRHWRKALEQEPDNFVIRKQIWALEHPEQFYPKINFDWQREQLSNEKKR
jgi:tetratricopeptide (TPR) repeat protein